MSNSIWAILVGSKIAENALVLSHGSTRTLREIYPSIEHIGRMNLRSEEASRLLLSSETELCVMGLSQSIAVHEDFVKTCLSWLVPIGRVSVTKLAGASTNNVHETLGDAAGRRVDPTTLKLFHLTRLVRNCYIHSDGVVSDGLVTFMTGMTRTQRASWERLSRRKFLVPTSGERFPVDVLTMVAALAVQKRLAYEVNLCLQRAIPKRNWADLAVSDYFSIRGSKSVRDPAAARALIRYAGNRFAPIGLSEITLRAALTRYALAEK
jgi:hypothetical protein